MADHLKKSFIWLMTMTIASILSLSFSYSQEKPEMDGWGKNSAYDKLYVPSERDKFKAIAVGYKEIVPLPGMSPGVALIVRDPEDEIITVHLGPKWFIDPDSIRIKKGDKVTVKGVWAEIKGEDFVIASKVSIGDFYEFKVRLTSDGTPFWTMTPEEITRERASD
jgi:hypothetical protein